MALVGYVEVLWNKGHATAWSIVIAMVGLLVPALINLSGVRNMAITQHVRLREDPSCPRTATPAPCSKSWT